MPADAQVLYLAEKDRKLKQPMADRLEAKSKVHSDTMSVLTTNLKTLSDTLSSAFSLLQQTLEQRSNPSHMPSPYYNQYPNLYAPSPSSPMPSSQGPSHYSMYRHTPSSNSAPTQAVNQRYDSSPMSSQAHFDDSEY